MLSKLLLDAFSFVDNKYLQTTELYESDQRTDKYEK